MTPMTETRSDSLETVPANLAEICTLSPSALEDRIAMIRREIAPYASATQKLETGVAWDFDSSPEMRAKLENLARLERDCCSSLEFEIWENPSRTRLRFEISGADPNSGLFDGLSLENPFGLEAAAGVEAGGAAEGKRLKKSDAAEHRWRPIAKRGGLAVVASFVVCCVLPLAIVSVAGVTIAAPLMKLDNPLTIGAGAVLFGTLFWLFEKRRMPTAASRAPESTRGCDC